MSFRKKLVGGILSAVLVAICAVSTPVVAAADDAKDSGTKRSWFNRLRKGKKAEPQAVEQNAGPTSDAAEPAAIEASPATPAPAPSPAQPPTQPQAQPKAQPPTQPQAQPPTQPEAQPPTQPQAQPPTQPQAQPPTQPQGPAASANALEESPAVADAEPITVAAAPADAGAAPVATEAEAAPPKVGRDVAEIASLLRAGPLGREPSSAAYLDRIESGQATGAQLNDFATYLARRGLGGEAVKLQREAARLEASSPTIWINLGTLERAAGKTGPAVGAFRKAIEIDPSNATARYNLGSVYEQQGEYDKAVEEYLQALRLDPTLADPKVNPQVVNNELLFSVKLRLYQEQAGALGLPLSTIREGSSEREPDR